MDEVTVGLTALERAPLFAGLDREHLEEVLAVGRRASFQPGQAIVERGDPGDAMYILLGGAAEVDVGGRFHRLERGDFFGEMAVLAGKPREATVKAVEPREQGRPLQRRQPDRHLVHPQPSRRRPVARWGA